MRDFKYLSRDGERKEPRIGKLDANLDEGSSKATAVRQVRQVKVVARESKKQSDRSETGATRVIRDVLMDDDKVSSIKTKPAGTAKVVRTSPNYDAKEKASRVNRASGTMAGRWLQIRVWIKKLILGLIVLLALWGSYQALGSLSELFQRPIKSVTVEGEFHFISQERATQLITQEINDDFLQIDLSRIKAVLLDDPWVESVTLTRRWPDTLVVKIAEQKPIARWGEGFLNQRGEIVRVKEMKGLKDLPWLQGDEIYAAEILQQYQDLSLLLRARGLEIAELKCDSKKSWRLKIKNNVEIAIGRDQVMEKMRRFVTVYETQLQAVWKDVKSIDVRYLNGVAVDWVDGSETAKKMMKERSSKPAINNLTQ
jgi:cell division protein FtsQ